MHAVNSLQQRKHICGTAPTLEDLLNPIEETEIGHSDYRFLGGDNEIVAEALRTTMDTQDDEMDDKAHVVMCWVGPQALSPPSRARSSPSQAQQGLATSLGLASDIRSPSLRLKPGL